MNQANVPIIVAIIGLLSALLVVVFANWRQSRIEYKKWLRTKEDEARRERGLAVAELTRKLFGGFQAISWLTWKAKNDPLRLTEKDIAMYEADIKGVLPDIMGGRAVLASLSKDIHDRFSPLVQKLFDLDKRVAVATVLFRDDLEQGRNRLAGYHVEYEEFFESVLIISTDLNDLLSGDISG